MRIWQKKKNKKYKKISSQLILKAVTTQRCCGRCCNQNMLEISHQYRCIASQILTARKINCSKKVL